jgi:anti-sigma B factor antagonist
VHAVGPDLFSFEIRPDRRRVVLALRGELDIATVDRVQAAVRELRRAGWSSLVLDGRELTFVDSQGLNLLLALQREARESAWDFAIADGCRPLSRLLKITGLEEHFTRARAADLPATGTG